MEQQVSRRRVAGDLSKGSRQRDSLSAVTAKLQSGSRSCCLGSPDAARIAAGSTGNEIDSFCTGSRGLWQGRKCDSGRFGEAVEACTCRRPDMPGAGHTRRYT